MNVELTKKLYPNGDIYTTLKTNINSVTFYSNTKNYEENLQKYSKELNKEYITKKKIIDFKEAFLKGNTNNITMLKEALKQGINVLYHYDFMGCFSVEKVTNKTVKIEDICGNIKFLKYDYFNALLKDAFSFTMEV